MSFTVVIPARYASQRLPGKPLLDLAGKSMIQRVYDQARLSEANQVIVATDDERIEAEVNRFGGVCCMTREAHVSGTDRVEEVTSILGLKDSEVVVNVQGDEPLIPPAVINQVAGLLANPNAQMATLAEPIDRFEDLKDPNIVKVVADDRGNALYFSRAAIPYRRDGGLSDVALRHIGIYAYRISLLKQFVSWSEGRLEQIEKLEQLRVLEQGVKIQVAESVVTIPPGIDTASDLERTLAVLNAD